MSKQPCTYILASRYNGTLYIGVTSALYDRVMNHKHGQIQGFTDRYKIHQLVYYEFHATMEEAISREKKLKKWNRLWKIRLIEQMNPGWHDLINELEGLIDSGPGGQRGE